MPKYAYLQKVDGTENNNKFYRMTELGDGTFEALYGREGADKPARKIYSMYDWDKKFEEKLSSRKGYTDVTKFKSEVVVKAVKNSSGQIISTDAEVVSLITMLQSYANVATSASYEVNAKQVTQLQIDEAQHQIDNLSNSLKYYGSSDWDTDKFNKALTYLMVVIPRKMKKVADCLIQKDATRKEIEILIENEQSLLDSMAGQVLTNTATDNSTIEDDTNNDGQVTLLESLGLEIRPATKAEFEEAKRQAQEHGHRVKRVFRVVNKTTQKSFDADMAKATNKNTKTFWHGSRRQNWFSIINQGLRIRPSNAISTGSMWDEGIYFASDADKSMGYTDGGRWTGGGNSGMTYMALYEVRIGNQLVKNIHTSECYTISKIVKSQGYDSVHAKKGASLRKDEFVIYNKEQTTIKFLVEFS